MHDNSLDTPYLMTLSTPTKYGANYNWAATTAGTGKMTSIGSDAPNSICSKGWRLINQNDAELFSQKYKLSTAIKAPASLVYAGYSGNVENGHIWIWESTRNKSDQAYNLRGGENGDNFNPRRGDYFGYGGSIRCIAK